MERNPEALSELPSLHLLLGGVFYRGSGRFNRGIDFDVTHFLKSTLKMLCTNSYVNSVTPNCGDERNTRAGVCVCVCTCVCACVCACVHACMRA